VGPTNLEGVAHGTLTTITRAVPAGARAARACADSSVKPATSASANSKTRLTSSVPLSGTWPPRRPPPRDHRPHEAAVRTVRRRQALPRPLRHRVPGGPAHARVNRRLPGTRHPRRPGRRAPRRAAVRWLPPPAAGCLAREARRLTAHERPRPYPGSGAFVVSTIGSPARRSGQPDAVPSPHD